MRLSSSYGTYYRGCHSKDTDPAFPKRRKRVWESVSYEMIENGRIILKWISASDPTDLVNVPEVGFFAWGWSLAVGLLTVPVCTLLAAPTLLMVWSPGPTSRFSEDIA